MAFGTGTMNQIDSNSETYNKQHKDNKTWGIIIAVAIILIGGSLYYKICHKNKKCNLNQSTSST